jgi:uncharacterized protein (TIGR02118 family)
VLRLVGLWTEPQDVDAFDRDYLGSHVPRLSGLLGVEAVSTSRCIDGPYYRMTEVAFQNLDDIHAALDAPSGKEVLDAASNLAQKYGVRMEVLVVAEAS